MKIDWFTYQDVVNSLRDEFIKKQIHNLVKEYLIGTPTQVIKDELIALGILTENPQNPTEQRRNIVQPFNFVSNNDWTPGN
jgi:ERCC4-type nuclease